MSNRYLSLESAYLDVLKTIYNYQPNEKGVRETFGYNFLIKNIHNTDHNENFSEIKNRNINLEFQKTYAEWFIKGSGDTQKLEQLNQKARMFTDTSGHNILYPARISEQLRNIIDELRHDPYSRRATIMILNADDSKVMIEKRTNPNIRKEYPCTMGITYFIRDNELHSDVMMRSQNVVTTICYDFTNFAYLQKYIAAFLGIKAGSMIYHIVNAHIEPKDLELATLIVNTN